VTGPGFISLLLGPNSWLDYSRRISIISKMLPIYFLIVEQGTAQILSISVMASASL
jgi:hypothetical protein